MSNVLIELVFMTDGLSVDWAKQIVTAVRAADATRLIVVPTEWSAELLPTTGQKHTVISCGAGSNCTGTGTAAAAAAAAAGYIMPPTASHPSLIDSAGPSKAVTAAANTCASTPFCSVYPSRLSLACFDKPLPSYLF